MNTIGTIVSGGPLGGIIFYSRAIVIPRATQNNYLFSYSRSVIVSVVRLCSEPGGIPRSRIQLNMFYYEAIGGQPCWLALSGPGLPPTALLVC